MLVTETDNLNMTDFNEFLIPGLTNGPPSFDFDIENPFSQTGDTLHQLMNDLEIPMLMEEDEGHGGTPSPHGTSTPSPVQDEPWQSSLKLEDLSSVDCWGTDMPVDFLDSPPDVDWTEEQTLDIKEEEIPSMVQSPPLLPPSPSASNSSDSADSGVHCWLNTNPAHKRKPTQQKVVLDTPPVSPPRRETTPPTSPQTAAPQVSSSTPLVMVSPLNLIPIKPSATTVSTTNGPSLIFTTSNQQPKKIKIQPRPIKLEPLDPAPSPCPINSLPLAPRIKVVSKQELISGNTTVWAPGNLLSSEPLCTNDAKLPIPAINTSRGFPAAAVPSNQANQIELKLMKKHQRMIKNRESACQSRRKKKEYVTALEQQLDTLRVENQQLRQENHVLKERLSQLEGTGSTSRIGGKPSKGTVTALFAVLLVASLNMGPLSGMLRGRILVSPALSTNDLDPSPPLTPGSGPGRPHTGRSLLWAASVLPDLDALNGTSPGMPTCPVPINQTESRRLDSELRGWFEEELGHRENVTAVTEVAPPLLLSLAPSMPPSPPRSKPRRKRPARRKPVEPGAEVALYSGPQRYAALMDAIRRRDDTFYVVSLNGDHLLLPARAHNHTLRPKVSLVMPTNLAANGSVPRHHVAMMQIDCEVTDTRLIHVDESFLPAKFRSNATEAPPPSPTPTPTENATPSQSKAERLQLPYAQVYKTHKALFHHAKDFP